MPRDPQLFKKEKEQVIAYFTKLDEQKEFGVKKYLTAWCIAKTAEKFNKRPPTVEGYLYRN